MMKKEFEINDILNAVNSISKIEKKNKDLVQTKKENILTLKTELKPNNKHVLVKNVLVLDKVIE